MSRGSRRTQGEERERGGVYKLSTLSRKMALKLSRACGSTRDSGKLPFIASQTIGRLTALRMITRTHTCMRTRLTVLCPITQPAAIYIIPPPSLPLLHPPSVFLSDFYCPRQPHAFMWLISCKITASYFPAAPPPPQPPLHNPSLMGAKRCKLAEREGLLYTHHCGYLSSLFIIVIIINALL